MDKSQLLAKKNPLTLYEATQLLPRRTGGSVAAVSILVDAITANELAAAIRRWPRRHASLGVTLWDGDINQMETTVQRRDLDAWLKTKELAVAVQVVANLENAQIPRAVKQRTATARGKSQANDTMTSDTTAHRQNVWAAGLGQVESSRINWQAKSGETITHRLNSPSIDALAAVIVRAKKSAVNAADYQSVWTALVKLAASAFPPLPLLGQVDGESIKYDAGNRVKIFTKGALRGMMSRTVTKPAKEVQTVVAIAALHALRHQTETGR